MKSGKLPKDNYDDSGDADARIGSSIAFYQERLSQAIDSVKGKEIHPSVSDPLNGSYAEVDGNDAGIVIINDEYLWEICFGFYGGVGGNTVPTCRFADEGAKTVLECPLETTAEEATALADGLLKSAGIDGMGCISAREAVFGSGTQNPYTEERGFALEYSRCAGGVYILAATGGGSADDVSRPWHAERMSFYVSDRGVVGFRWFSPYEVTGTLYEDSRILGIEDIKSAFEHMILITNAWVNANGASGNSLVIDIDTAELGLIRVTQQDRADEGLLIPAWVFSGKKHYEGSAGGILPTHEIQLILNAIDGSVIDLSLGY